MPADRSETVSVMSRVRPWRKNDTSTDSLPNPLRPPLLRPLRRLQLRQQRLRLPRQHRLALLLPQRSPLRRPRHHRARPRARLRARGRLADEPPRRRRRVVLAVPEPVPAGHEHVLPAEIVPLPRGMLDRLGWLQPGRSEGRPARQSRTAKLVRVDGRLPGGGVKPPCASPSWRQHRRRRRSLALPAPP